MGLDPVRGGDRQLTLLAGSDLLSWSWTSQPARATRSRGNVSNTDSVASQLVCWSMTQMTWCRSNRSWLVSLASAASRGSQSLSPVGNGGWWGTGMSSRVRTVRARSGVSASWNPCSWTKVVPLA